MKTAPFSAAFLLAAFLLSGLSGSLSAQNRCGETFLQSPAFRQECKAFLQKTPCGLQLRQQRAIESAMAGDGAPLHRVRNSRNAAPLLPDGVDTLEMPGKGLRLYLPRTGESSMGKKGMPLLVYLHGGGWVFGSLNSCADFCAMMAQKGVAVLAVDYPLAPEAPYPAALETCCAALDFAREKALEWGCDPSRIFMGGDSAGGNLTAAVAVKRINDGKTLPAGLVLFYPVTEVWDGQDARSWRRFGNGYGLDSGIMNAMNRAYLGGKDPHDGCISPSCAPDDLLRQFPPTLLVGGTCDILLDQSRSFVQRLGKLGVPARSVFLKGACHLFITVGGQPAARETAMKKAAAFMLQPLD